MGILSKSIMAYIWKGTLRVDPVTSMLSTKSHTGALYKHITQDTSYSSQDLKLYSI